MTADLLPTASPTRHFAIILAAGASSRMGRCKASLPWGNQTLLGYQAAQWLAAGVTPIVVLAPHNADRQFDCPAGTVAVVNSDPSRGKTQSLRIGLQAIPAAAEAIAIAAVDQPRTTEIYQILLQRHQQHPSLITAPTYGDRLGHPLLISSRLRPELENLREESQGLRQLIQRYYTTIDKVPFFTPLVLSDLNTPEAYQSQRPATSPAHR
ncbi:MAG TPA: nucleotidyltransferase family protein [Coleofasciculaceae cyanobacterium]